MLNDAKLFYTLNKYWRPDQICEYLETAWVTWTHKVCKNFDTLKKKHFASIALQNTI